MRLLSDETIDTFQVQRCFAESVIAATTLRFSAASRWRWILRGETYPRCGEVSSLGERVADKSEASGRGMPDDFDAELFVLRFSKSTGVAVCDFLGVLVGVTLITIVIELFMRVNLRMLLSRACAAAALERASTAL